MSARAYGENMEAMSFSEVTAWFGRYTPMLDRFVRERGLAIEKYYHDSPVWRFTFAHPHSGNGAVDLWRVDENLCHVHAVVWIDDARSGTRALRTHLRRFLEAGDDCIEKELNCAIDETLSWRPDEWLRKGVSDDAREALRDVTIVKTG